jgi:hypothetical protein
VFEIMGTIMLRRDQREESIVERAITDYYSALSNEEAGELALWGDFAMCEVSGESD